MEKEISLYPHNEEGYKLLVNGLQDYPLAFIEHATGTGKSFILLKYLYLHARNKRILFITMHDEMFHQLFNEQMPTLNLARNDFNCFDTMIYPNILKNNMEDIIANYDCIVLDEAHHCGADKWGLKIEELKKLVLNTPGKIMIGATATGIRYLDDYMDVSEKYFDGHTVSRLPVSTSILKNLLPAPMYINSLAACQDYFMRVAKKMKRIPLSKDTQEMLNKLEKIDNRLQNESRIPSVLKKYGVKPGEKYIIFCKDIADLKNKRKEAETWFEEIGPIKTFAAHSGQRKDQNMDEITAFGEEREEISLMFAVDIFNEGFHIEGVDGIFMFRKTKSPIIYFQQIGRALSFSVRRNQIKIFDFVDNISENEVIYELYKEILNEAKRLVKENPENKALYEQIISRFQIIDETTKIMDELHEIEKYIDDNFISHDNILYAISKLEEYRSFYPTTNFQEELLQNRISKDYIRAYNYICKMSDDLTIDHISRLQALNIEFNHEINLPIEERLDILKGYKSFSELHEAEFETFIANYITFYNNYNRRPKESTNLIENTLYQEYREYLKKLTKSKLSKMLSKFSFPSTLEEIVLTDGYPDKELINKYIEYIKIKLDNNKELDVIELKVMKKIVNMISLKDVNLINRINNYDDINLKLENAIERITYYKKNINPNETFANIELLRGEKETYKAIKLIHKNALRITTPQFERLLELNIVLPPSISMTLEERKEKLGIYLSFYEKEKSGNNGTINRYITFITTNKRRPNKKNDDEIELATEYENYISGAPTKKVLDICAILEQNDITLSFYETVICNKPINATIINSYIKIIIKKLHNNEPVTKEELKCLKMLDKNGYKVNNLSQIINLVSGIQEIDAFIEFLKENKKEQNKLPEVRRIINMISARSKYLTKKHIEELSSIDVSISKELIDKINSLTDSINLYEEEIHEINSFVNELTTYLNINKRRPPQGTKLDIDYRNHIAKLSKNQIIEFVTIFTSIDLPLTFEEKMLIGQVVSEEEIDIYLEEIRRHTSLHIPLDDLEIRVTSNMKTKGMISSRLNKIIKERRTKKEETLEDKIVASLKETIAKNPNLPINYESTLYHISAVNRRKLEQFRMLLLSRSFFEEVLTIIKTTKKPLVECLTIKQYETFYKYAELKYLENDCLLMIDNIKELDIEYRFLKKDIEHEELIDKYIEFIKNNMGERPNISSEDEEEQRLATSFNEVKSLLTKKDLTRIDAAIKESRVTIDPDEFYVRFYNFIINNGRFPCGNSDSKEEVTLNNLYITLGSKLSKEQLLELKKLKKEYSLATVKANLEFAKKQK